MRIVEADNFVDPRDALSHEWQGFMRQVIPEANWLPMPNLGRGILEFISDWKLNGFILTGGNNLDEYPARDKTEMTIINYALQQNLPVLGVCRGFQMMASYWKVHIGPCAGGGHAGTKHRVQLLDAPVTIKKNSIMVNSYHDNCGPSKNKFEGTPLIPFALDSEGLVEGFFMKNKKMAAVMWHPERENPISEFDEKLVRAIFADTETG